MARNEDEMTIVEHLVEFRRRFIAVVLCFFLVFCITLLFAGQLYAYLTRGFDKPLLILGPNDILWIYINLASLMARSLIKSAGVRMTAKTKRIK